MIQLKEGWEEMKSDKETNRTLKFGKLGNESDSHDVNTLPATLQKGARFALWSYPTGERCLKARPSLSSICN